MTAEEIKEYAIENIGNTWREGDKYVFGITHRDNDVECVGWVEGGFFKIYNVNDGDDIGYGVNNPHIVKSKEELDVYMNQEELYVKIMNWFYDEGGMRKIREWLSK